MTGLEAAGIAGIAGAADFVGIELPTLALAVVVVEIVAGVEEDMETDGRRN